MNRSTRRTAVTAVLALVLGVVALVVPGTVAAATAAAAAALDGSSSAHAAPSCWAIKQNDPTAASGIFWLQTPTLVAPQQFYCDMTTDGGGWVLVGRGRNGWSWSDTGQSTPGQVRNTPSGTGAFSPAALPSKTIDGLLDTGNGGRVDSLPDGVRVVRATNTAGTSYQEMRIFLTGRQHWSWAIGGGEKDSKVTIGGSAYSGGNTQEWGVDSAYRHLTTYELKSHNWSKGFGYGTQIAGSNSATSYLWMYASENAALPFAQVWLRPKLTSPSYPSIPQSGLPASTVSPLMSSTTAPMSWGVTGLVGTYKSEFDLEVEAMTYIGHIMYVGGKFANVQHGASGTPIAQPYLAAFDVDTGDWISSFRPTLNGEVWDLQAMPDGNLLVAGDFTSAGAANTTGIAEVDAGTGKVVPTWHTHVAYTGTGGPVEVKTIDVQGSYVYFGGRFNRLYNDQAGTSVTDSRLARAHVATGLPDYTWKPSVDGTVVDLDASSQGDRVYLVGYFAHIDGVSSPNEGAVGIVDGRFVTGLNPWVPSIGSSARYQQAIREYGGSVWQGGSEHILSQYDRATYTRQHSYVARSGGDFQTITEIDGVIYAGCHCGNYAYQDTYDWSSALNTINSAGDVRSVKYIVAVDAATGRLESEFWPGALGTRAGNGAWELTPDPNGCLWFGGDFTRGSYVNGSYEWLGGFGKFCPRDTTAPSAPQNLTTTRTAGNVKLSWGASTDNSGVAPLYEVLRGDRVIATTGSTSYTDLAPSLPDTYWVRAIDGTGNRSATTSGTAVAAAAIQR